MMRELREQIEQDLRVVYGSYPRFYYAGSYGKRTMIKASFDLDIVIYFPPTERRSLREIYNSVHRTLLMTGYKVNPKTVSLQLPYEGGFHIDVVPGRAQDYSYRYATLYKNGEDSTMQTSLKVHIETIRDSGTRPIIKLLKLWKVRHLLDCKTFALEQIAIRALKGYRKDDYSVCLTQIFEFIRDNVLNIRIVDPANSNNIIEVPRETRFLLHQAAINSLNANYWSSVVW
ncbi:hypothetical protein NIES4071_108710 (plasmid) [Calothrix sp. NIES-4071]|nr:hypothetical protein NIES4071_108710 [Calothrix sp. NIES-4071]BAZ65117.1 hypothetical protein NIES4105_108500 [Calothrix sp. NIES-4105]